MGKKKRTRYVYVLKCHYHYDDAVICGAYDSLRSAKRLIDICHHSEWEHYCNCKTGDEWWKLGDYADHSYFLSKVEVQSWHRSSKDVSKDN